MEFTGLPEKSKAFQYAILCNKITRILRKIEGNEGKLDLNFQEISALGRGAKLLKQIVEGAILVEGGKRHGFSPSQQGLSAYGHALYAIKRLDLTTEHKEFTDLFLEFHSSLATLEKKSNLEKTRVDELKNFFSELSDFFSDDIQRDLFRVPNKEQTISSFTSKGPHYVLS